MSSRKLKVVKEEKPVEDKPKKVTKKASSKKLKEMELVLEEVQSEPLYLVEKCIHEGINERYPEIEALGHALLKLNIKKALSGLKNE